MIRGIIAGVARTSGGRWFLRASPGSIEFHCSTGTTTGTEGQASSRQLRRRRKTSEREAHARTPTRRGTCRAIEGRRHDNPDKLTEALLIERSARSIPVQPWLGRNKVGAADLRADPRHRQARRDPIAGPRRGPGAAHFATLRREPDKTDADTIGCAQRLTAEPLPSRSRTTPARARRGTGKWPVPRQLGSVDQIWIS